MTRNTLFTVACVAWWLAFWIAALVLAGCGVAPVRVAGQDRAEMIVWRGVYGERATPPEIEWVTNLDCFGVHGGLGFALDDGRCVAGANWCEYNFAKVAWYEIAPRISATAYAHELLHEHLFRIGVLNGDGDHVGPEWKANGLLAEANQALVDGGL